RRDELVERRRGGPRAVDGHREQHQRRGDARERESRHERPSSAQGGSTYTTAASESRLPARPGPVRTSRLGREETMPSPLSIRRIAAALWAALVASTVFAGGLDALKDTTPNERAVAQTAMMKQKLGLTDAQEPQIAA